MTKADREEEQNKAASELLMMCETGTRTRDGSESARCKGNGARVVRDSEVKGGRQADRIKHLVSTVKEQSHGRSNSITRGLGAVKERENRKEQAFVSCTKQQE